MRRSRRGDQEEEIKKRTHLLREETKRREGNRDQTL